MKKSKLWSSNLAKPFGLFGAIVGQYLACDNYEINHWATAMLDIQPNDHILEIGFGPGVAVKDIARRAPQGYIAGFDYSKLMVATARLRNFKTVSTGRVDLRHSCVCHPPTFNTQFDKIIAINNVMYWKKPIESLKQLRSLLKPNGRISLVIQRNENLLKTVRFKEEIDWYMHCLREAGFTKVGTVINPIVLRRPFKNTEILAGISIVGYAPVACQPEVQADNLIEMLYMADATHNNLVNAS
jgi:SAM-dependent methyltransferase